MSPSFDWLSPSSSLGLRMSRLAFDSERGEVNQTTSYESREGTGEVGVVYRSEVGGMMIKIMEGSPLVR